MNRYVACICVALGAAACSNGPSDNPLATTGTTASGLGAGGGGFGGSSYAPPEGMYPELWYSVDQLLVLVEVDASDGSIATVVSSDITAAMDVGQTAITMLDDGSLLMSRLSQLDDQSYLFHIPDPPRDGSDVSPQPLGTMSDGIMLEGLYTDCEGRVYGMDTGVDDTSPDGNRLLRFTGNVVAGDFAYVVVSDLATADVADIDDMGPAIVNNDISDNPGLAIDTGTVHVFNFETGSGSPIAQAGTFGIHALGGPLFRDNRARLYVLSDEGQLFEVDPVGFTVSDVIGTGPTPAEGIPGWSALAGPLTDCESGFTPPR